MGLKKQKKKMRNLYTAMKKAKRNSFLALPVFFIILLFLVGCGETASEQSEAECYSDSDCVPAACCHPKECVSANNAPLCDAIACTMSCEPGTLDCGQGRCICSEGKCSAEIKDVGKERMPMVEVVE